MMRQSGSNAWSDYFAKQTNSLPSEEDFMHSMLHGWVILLKCALEIENIRQLEWLFASYPAFVTTDSEGRT